MGSMVRGVVLVLLTSACASGPIADAAALDQTQWTVLEIDGEPVPTNEIHLSFDSLDRVTLVTHYASHSPGGLLPRCRWAESAIPMDTDGHALNFIGFEDIDMNANQHRTCDAALEALHDRIAVALRGNDSWEVSAETLELIGTSRVSWNSLAAESLTRPELRLPEALGDRALLDGGREPSEEPPLCLDPGVSCQ